MPMGSPTVKVRIGGAWVDVGGAGDPGTPATPVGSEFVLTQGMGALSIPNVMTLIAEIDFGTASYDRYATATASVLGTAIGVTATPRLQIGANGNLIKQAQSYVPVNVTSTLETTAQWLLPAGPGLIQAFLASFSAGTFDLVADASFCSLNASVRPTSAGDVY